jgi:hypothetical protein
MFAYLVHVVQLDPVPFYFHARIVFHLIRW